MCPRIKGFRIAVPAIVSEELFAAVAGTIGKRTGSAIGNRGAEPSTCFKV